MAIEKTGIRAVVEGYDGFIRAVDTVNKKITEVGTRATEAAKKSSTLDKNLGSISGVANKFAQAVGGVPGPVGEATSGITGMISQLGILSPAMMAGVTAVAALGTAFVALGMRGASMRGMIESFDRLTQSIGLAGDALLDDLRNASAGTIRDMELLRLANTALAGAAGEFGKEFGNKLPKLLEIARVQARATGQSVDFLFQSLITGIKRGSPLLIDNTGLVLNVTKANQQYADSIGKTVEQLTAEEKQIALLNATATAGQAAIDSLGNIQETAAEKIARIEAIISNTFDRLALAVQPAFEQILDSVTRFIGMISEVVAGLAPIIGAIVSVITTIISTVLNAIYTFLEPFKNAIVSVLPYIGILVQGIQQAFAVIGQVVEMVFGGIVRFVTDIAKNFFGIDFNNLGKNFFEGAAAVFGSFANGIAVAANTLIFPAVIGIAKFIADLLVGQSPPPKGPLSQIDKGGANTMAAWLDGFVSQSLEPVDQVVANVNASLGDIGKMSLPAVNKRLAQLDKALLPFQQQLEIVKSQFEAISAPAEAALNAIDRQLEQANQALLRGEEGAVERVRMLDAQRESIQGALDAQQQLVDAAQVQLSLTQAQQARERALLAIRKSQLPTKAGAPVPTTGGEAKLPKEKEPKGEAPPPEAAKGTPIPAGTEFPTLDELTGQADIDAAKQGIAEAFLKPLLESGELAKFGQNQALLGEQMVRFGDLGGAESGIAGGINKIGAIFDTTNPESPLSKIKTSVSNLFDPSSPNSISAMLTNFGNSLANLPLVDSIRTFFGSIFDPAMNGSAAQRLNQMVNDIFGANSTVGIIQVIKNFGVSLSSLPLIGDMLNFVNSIFSPDIAGSPVQLLLDMIDSIVNPEREGSIPYFFATLPQNVADAASSFAAKFSEVVLTPVKDLLTGTDAGSVGWIIQGVVDFFAAMPDKIINVLKGFGAAIWTAVAIPIINMVNGVIGIFETAINQIQYTISTVIDSFAKVYGAAAGVLGQDVTATENAFKDQFAGLTNPVKFGRISMALPEFLQIKAPEAPAAATGGMFGGGLLRVGEKGEELIASSNRLSVFPNSFVRAMDTLAQVMAQPAPMPIPAMAGGDRSYDNSINAVFNGVQGPNDVMRKFYSINAFRT